MNAQVQPLRQIRWLFTWTGTVTRRQYFAAGTILTLLKYAIDRQIALLWGQHWNIWNYFLPTHQRSILGTQNRNLYLVLWTVALPFFAVGVALTLRRMRSAGRKASWIFLFFVPVVNLLFFLTLCLLPEVRSAADASFEEGPHDAIGSAAFGVLLSIALALALVVLSISGLDRYGLGLFLGVPFSAGFVSGAIFNHRQQRTWQATAGVGILAVLLLGVVLFGAAYEGLVCLLMALPLAIPLSIIGSGVAWWIQFHKERLPSAPTMGAWILLLPLAMYAEQAINPQPPLLAVTTGVEIDAPPEVVWKHVISFATLAPPKEALFKTGIAYPTSAVIHGTGVGAVRHCKFSTGEFVEPITTWDEGRLLAFDVAAQPMSMRELSFTDITPPHLERNYMRSEKGQFRFVALPSGRTRLEGTTWYRNYFWPQPYWRMWSDYIVHRIHMRVLGHVKAEAEGARR